MATPFGQAGSKSAAKAKKTPFGQTSKSTKAAKSKSKSVKPKVVNKSIKVSQAQIDQIKKLGMTKALAMVKANKGSVRQGAVEITNEAVRRLYGQERFDKAMGRAKRPTGLTPKRGKAKAKSNFTYGSGNPTPVNKKPMTPFEKDMARRGIYY
jgi:beta-mannanase